MDCASGFHPGRALRRVLQLDALRGEERAVLEEIEAYLGTKYAARHAGGLGGDAEVERGDLELLADLVDERDGGLAALGTVAQTLQDAGLDVRVDGAGLL